MKVEVDIIDIVDKQLKAIEFEGIKYNLTEYEEITQPTTRPYKKRKGKYYDNTYKRDISKDEIDTVKKAILHVGPDYTPTTEGIAKQTGLEIRVVQSVIHKMGELKLITSEKLTNRKMRHRLK